jgi:hypothetical protein
MNKSEALKGLRVIPGVGREIALDLYRDLGIRTVSDLKGQDPEKLYARLCDKAGIKIDRCMLYVMRCAVYYAKTPSERRDPELLKWWNWKD